MTLEERMGLLLVKIAVAESEPRMSGPDGNAWGFCQEGHPEVGTASGFGDSQLEAALNYLESIYP